MTADDLQTQILKELDGLTGRMRAAATYLVDHPEDVAFLSMRELAKRASIPPSTMTRLAQRLGFDGFEQLRAVHVDALRGHASSFEGRTQGLLDRRSADGDFGVVTDTLAVVSGHLRRLSESDTIAALDRAADLVLHQDRLFCIGARSSYPAMYLASYLLSLIGEQTVLVDGAGGIGLDQLRTLKKSDAVLALAIAPYTRNTVEAVAFAAEHNVPVMAITDSLTSPIARLAQETIVVPTDTPSFLHTMAPAFVMVEALAALVAAKRGKSAVQGIAAAEDHLARFSSYVTDRSARRGRTA